VVSRGVGKRAGAMSEPENWEESANEEVVYKPAAPKLNPNASSFSFNPNAASFSFQPRTAAAAAAAPPPAPEPAPAPAPAPEPAPAPAPAAPVEAAAERVEKLSVEEAADSGAAAAQGGEEEEEGEVKESKRKLKAEEDARKEAEMLEAEDQREHLNIVFIGHVDAGKSTIGGQILFLAGMVDDRTIQKYEREAKDKNRDSWYMAYIMDTNDEERAKGKTVEVGRAHFETANKRYTILDAPGHKNYVPHMIQGAAQADIGVLVIAARKGEFETGFERGGQTREHAQLAKTLGVSKLVVVVNKMDEPSVAWGKERFDEITTKLTPFLKSCGYNVKKDVTFVPISGLHGYGIKDRVTAEMCPWHGGPSLFEVLDGLEPQDRDATAPFRMPVLDKYREMGTIVMGKVEAGVVTRGDSLTIMPNKLPVKVSKVFRDTDEIMRARPGENIRLLITGAEEEDVSPGFVMCDPKSLAPVCTEFICLLSILELLEHKSIFTAGYKAVLHIHCVTEEVEVLDIVAEIDPKTKKPKPKKSLFLKSGSIAKVRIQAEQSIAIETFKAYPQLGRFTLRDEGKTIAIGKIEKVLPMTSS